jgi:hypothetical protein
MLQYSQLFKAQLKALAWDLAKAGQLHQLCKALNKGRKDTLRTMLVTWQLKLLVMQLVNSAVGCSKA